MKDKTILSEKERKEIFNMIVDFYIQNQNSRSQKEWGPKLESTIDEIESLLAENLKHKDKEIELLRDELDSVSRAYDRSSE